MQHSILPPEIVGQTSERILLKDPAKGHVIYCSVVCFVLLIFLLLPILTLTVSVQSNGIIRPVMEKIEVSLMVSGTVTHVPVTLNQYVNKGDLLLEIDKTLLEEKLNVIRFKLSEMDDTIHDLELMTAFWQNSDALLPRLRSLHCKNETLCFVSELTDINHQLTKADKEKERYQMLRKEKLVSLSDLETKELEQKKIRLQKEMLVQRQLELWNKNLKERRLTHREIFVEKEQVEKEIVLYTITSPIAGTVEQLSGIVSGRFLEKGTTLAVISPDTDLVAEIYVSPRDIGLLKPGIKTCLQIDAFDHHQWGLIQGSVQEIADDFILQNNTPVFRIRSSMTRTCLTLRNGRKGYLKKGMTLRARFLITEVTFLQLLYQHMDDWLNPLAE